MDAIEVVVAKPVREVASEPVNRTAHVAPFEPAGGELAEPQSREQDERFREWSEQPAA